jgi:hypothetical protein
MGTPAGNQRVVNLHGAVLALFDLQGGCMGSAICLIRN